MTVEVASGRPVPAGKKVYSAIGRCRFAATALGAGFFAISVSSFGADLRTGRSTAIAVSPSAAPASHRPPQADPIDLPKEELELSALRARMIDQLYQELMRSSECLSVSGASC
jgi:hypothetical protein